MLASMKRQPSSTQSTMPSSITRLVEEIRKASELAGCAPLTSTDREAARAANEQEDEMKPKKAANPACFGPRSPSARPICSRLITTRQAATASHGR